MEKIALFNEVKDVLEEAKSILKDYGVEIEDCLIDFDACEESGEYDEDVIDVIRHLKDLDTILEG